jgi:hypothetical protein
MTLRRRPDHTLGPYSQLTQFLDLRVIVRGTIGLRQATRIEDPGLGTHLAQQARGLFGQQSALGAVATRAIQQQNARRMRSTLCGQQAFQAGLFKYLFVQIR